MATNEQCNNLKRGGLMGLGVAGRSNSHNQDLVQN
jgi:hypothetical protein